MEILQIGSTGPSVELLQSTLMKLGFYSGKINGVFGNLTFSSVKRFQRNFGIAVDGVVGNATWDALYPYINGNTSYVIQKGDTLYSIAKNFGTTVNRIIFANSNLNVNNLPIGLKIVVPFGNIVPTNISYSSNILKMNISAFSKIYPFINVGIVGSSFLRKFYSIYKIRKWK